MQRFYSIKDVKVGAFLKPMCLENHVEATRAFARTVKAENSMVAEYPEDFELWYIGTFDAQNGGLNSVKQEFLINGITVLSNMEKPIIKGENHAN